jgi:hypothetical protein
MTCHTERRAVLDWHGAPSLPGNAEACDLLDAIIGQLSGERVDARRQGSARRDP